MLPELDPTSPIDMMREAAKEVPVVDSPEFGLGTDASRVVNVTPPPIALAQRVEALESQVAQIQALLAEKSQP